MGKSRGAVLPPPRLRRGFSRHLAGLAQVRDSVTNWRDPMTKLVIRSPWQVGSRCHPSGQCRDGLKKLCCASSRLWCVMELFVFILEDSTGGGYLAWDLGFVGWIGSSPFPAWAASVGIVDRIEWSESFSAIAAFTLS